MCHIKIIERTEGPRQMTTVREFSAIGPCITLGTFIKRTPKTIIFIDRHGDLGRVGGRRVQNDMVHIVPCVSCQDHERSQYPNGYEN